MISVGSVFLYGETVYLVKEVRNNGVVAQMCMISPDESDTISPISGVNLYLSKEKVENECKVLGIAEEE